MVEPSLSANGTTEPPAAYQSWVDEILQAAVGAVGGMLLCWKCGLVKVAKKHGIYFDPAEK